MADGAGGENIGKQQPLHKTDVQCSTSLRKLLDDLLDYTNERNYMVEQWIGQHVGQDVPTELLCEVCCSCCDADINTTGETWVCDDCLLGVKTCCQYRQIKDEQDLHMKRKTVVELEEEQLCRDVEYSLRCMGLRFDSESSLGDDKNSDNYIGAAGFRHTSETDGQRTPEVVLRHHHHHHHTDENDYQDTDY